jgi:hypothetical protein
MLVWVDTVVPDRVGVRLNDARIQNANWRLLIQQPVISLYLEKKNVVHEQQYGKIIYYARLVYLLLSSNFLVTSHDDSTRSQLNNNIYLGIIATYTIRHSTLNHSKYT